MQTPRLRRADNYGRRKRVEPERTAASGLTFLIRIVRLLPGGAASAEVQGLIEKICFAIHACCTTLNFHLYVED